MEKASSKDTENTRDEVSNGNDPRRGSESRSNHWEKRGKNSDMSEMIAIQASTQAL